MRFVLDTNVLVSGVFFGGQPLRVLEAWRDGRVVLVVSPDLLEEYRRVGERLADRFPGVDFAPFLALLAVRAEFVEAPPLPAPVCRDPDDDKFIACALAGEADVIVSGDRDLLSLGRVRGVEVLRPREFLARCASRSPR